MNYFHILGKSNTGLQSVRENERKQIMWAFRFSQLSDQRYIPDNITGMGNPSRVQWFCWDKGTEIRFWEGWRGVILWKRVLERRELCEERAPQIFIVALWVFDWTIDCSWMGVRGETPWNWPKINYQVKKKRLLKNYKVYNYWHLHRDGKIRLPTSQTEETLLNTQSIQ